VAPGYATYKRAMGERLTGGSLFSVLDHINPSPVPFIRKFELEATLILETNSLADCATQKSKRPKGGEKSAI